MGGVGGPGDVTGEEQGEMLTWQKAKVQMRNGSTGRSAIKWGRGLKKEMDVFFFLMRVKRN